MRKIFFVLVLLAAMFFLAVVFVGCVNLEAPPPQFIMYCDVCGMETIWGVKPDYFYCRESGTTWEGT